MPFPEEATLILTAKWMGVAPWELIDQHPGWLEWANTVMVAQSKAQEIANKRASSKRRA